MDSSRNGIPTSSQMSKVMSNGKSEAGTGAPFYSYLEEKRFERELNRSLNTDHSVRPTSWGHALEGYVYEKFFQDAYWLVSNKTVVHESGLFAGSPDLVNDTTVGDIKCPWTLLSFMKTREALNAGVETLKIEFPEHFWQLVSNAILLDKNEAELIVFCPSKIELNAIREYVDGIDDINVFKYKFIVDLSDEELPYIPETSKVGNWIALKFEVKQEWKDQLMERVKLFNAKLKA